MSNFKTPIRVNNITEAQFLEIKPELEKLGYKIKQSIWNEDYIFATNIGRISEQGGNFSIKNLHTTLDKTRTIIENYNKDLILALCAMREGNEFYEEEAVIRFQGGSNDGIKVGELFIAGKIYPEWVNQKGKSNKGHDKKNLRKATKEEILAHFGTPQVQQISTRLPEKWAVKLNSYEDVVMIHNYLRNSNISFEGYGVDCFSSYYYINENTKKVVAYEPSGLFSDYTYYSFQEWKELFLNNKTIINNQNQKSNGNEKPKAIEVCRLTPTITAGQRIKSNPVQGRSIKATISRGHQRNQKINSY